MSAWVIGLGVAVGGCLALAVWLWPHMSRKGMIARMARWCQENRALALTYDDGPGPELTGRLLDMLGAHGARATFFLLGRRAARAPSTADRTRAEGHESGCHTHDHLNAWKTWPWKARRDVRHGYETLARWVGESGVFRPPYGKMTLLTAYEVRRRGASVGWWTVDSGDTWERLPRVDAVVERVERAGGGVVLLHDFDREGPDAGERSEFVLRTTAGLLELAQREGWRVVTIGEVMEGAGLA